MRLQANPEALPFGVAVAISGGLAVLAWRRRGMPAARAFAVMMAGEAAWALFEALELMIVDLPVKRLCFVLRATGAVTMILALLAFVLRFTGCDRWLEPRRFGVLCAPSLALLAAAWTNPWHHRYWAALQNARIGRYWIAMPRYGPGFWAHFAYSYALVAVAAVLLARAVFRYRGVFRVQAAIMLFGVLLPWVVNIIDMTQLFGFIHVDSAAIAFGVTGLAFLPGLFHYRLLDLTPVAWAAVVEGMKDAVVVIDALGRIAELNPAAERLAGRKSDQLRGTKAARAFRRWPALAERLEGAGELVEASFELDGPDPAWGVAFDARLSRLGRGGRAAGWVLVLREITDLKHAQEERLRRLSEQAARLEAEAANRAKDQFLATLSHELRTPLTPVLATVTAMLDQPAPALDDSLRPVLEMIRRNVNLQVRLIDDLLDLARIRGGKLHLAREAVDAHELVRRVVEICRDEIRAAGLQLVLDLAARRHDVDADPIRLQQVLWNLIKNAIKFTPAGGTVTVRSRNESEGLSSPSAGLLILTVSDTGIGIDPGMLLRIFDLFEQGGAASSRRCGGLGLGLSISRSIVEQHGGRLVAASAGAGRGASFTLELPTLAAVAAIPTIQPVPLSEETPSRPLTILLVDDNADTLNYLTELLTRRGHDVRPATGVAEALRRAAETRIDLLISDIELPDGTGLQLMKELCFTCPVPGIALSGFGSSDDIELSRSAGFAIHLIKPVDFRSLEEAIEHATAGPRAGSLVSR
ncbi:MAG TPA: histidine kinase N-terminal 7TM domain-containing protein [Isosphaeraceae bacterium]|nr:histidine kinase N-terminal 7TM domain-containing protein [Isosphaeraceae bacterium]